MLAMARAGRGGTYTQFSRSQRAVLALLKFAGKIWLPEQQHRAAAAAAAAAAAGRRRQPPD